MRLLGVDGCAAGWLVASNDPNGTDLTFRVEQDLAAIIRLVAADEGLAVIDIPIGLPDQEPRACDTAARAFCVPRHNSVFSTPCRATLAGATYVEACRLNFEARGKTTTKQLFGNRPKRGDRSG